MQTTVTANQLKALRQLLRFHLVKRSLQIAAESIEKGISAITVALIGIHDQFDAIDRPLSRIQVQDLPLYTLEFGEDVHKLFVGLMDVSFKELDTAESTHHSLEFVDSEREGLKLALMKEQEPVAFQFSMTTPKNVQ